MSFSPLLQELIQSLRYLPGVGEKSARRMAFQLLARGRDKGLRLAQALTDAMQAIRHCTQCRTFSEEALCQFCQNPKRDPQTLCIVETPADILAIEQTHLFRGHYFVLHGHLSPLDGIGPEQLGLPQLSERIRQHTVSEMIIATNPTVEGDATAHYIAELVKPASIKITRIAYGVPLGGELEYIDSGTLARALSHRGMLLETAD